MVGAADVSGASEVTGVEGSAEVAGAEEAGATRSNERRTSVYDFQNSFTISVLRASVRGLWCE